MFGKLSNCLRTNGIFFHLLGCAKSILVKIFWNIIFQFFLKIIKKNYICSRVHWTFICSRTNPFVEHFRTNDEHVSKNVREISLKSPFVEKCSRTATNRSLRTLIHSHSPSCEPSSYSMKLFYSICPKSLHRSLDLSHVFFFHLFSSALSFACLVDIMIV